MKKKFYIILFSLFVISLIKGCGGFPKYDATREKKLNKTIEITDVKREGLTSINKTMQAAPAIEYKNEKKPRRVNFGSSANATAGILYPNFPVTINFKNTKLSQGLVALGNMGGRNIIISDNVQGILNMEINNEPWNEVFNSVIELKKLSYTGGSKTGIIKIYTTAESGEIYSGTGGGSFSGTEIFNIYYEKPSEIKTQISSLFTAGEEGEALIMTENDENQTLIVKGTYKAIDEIEKILDQLDQKKPQILIEAFIVEVSPTFTQKLGARLGLSRTKEKGVGSGDTDVFISGVVGEPATKGTDLTMGTAATAGKSTVSNFLVGGTSGIGIIRKVSGEQLKFEIDALEEEGDSRTLSNPKLFTVSGKNATIEQGTQFAITQTITNENGTTSSSTNYMSANLILDVTANITGDGNVSLELAITNDSASTADPPVITAKKINTNVILADGDIAAIGGVLTESIGTTKKGVPGLSKIPLLGALFRSKANTDTFSELLIFIAPRII
jgi:type IV pilus assembly protein PilQ